MVGEARGTQYVAEGAPADSPVRPSHSLAVSTVPRQRGRLRLSRVPAWLPAAAVYLAAGVAMWWRAWSGYPRSSMVCACGDPASFAWFISWPAYALSHGQSLFFTSQVHVPMGMNLLVNTSVLALGVVLAPVTWLFGPILSLNVALTAAPVLSALSACACLRRALKLGWTASFVGGLLFGFSPFMMRNEAVNHLQVSFLALTPLIFWCCYELAVAQRGTWWRWGLGLGVLVALQFFVGVEILTIIALTAALSLSLAFFAALTRKGTLSAKFPFAVRGFVLAGAVAGALLAYPLWFALAGPGHIQGADWPYPAANGLARVVLPLAQSSFQQAHLPMIGYLGRAGTLGGYLGVPALAALVAAVVAVRRPLTKLCAAVTFILVWLSLGASNLPVSHGGEPAWLWLPWRAFDHVPVLDKMTPANFSAAVVWFVAMAGALLVDRIWPAAPAAGTQAAMIRPGATRATVLPATRAATIRMVGAGSLSLVLVIPWLLSWPLPFRTNPVPTPAWVSHNGARLPASAVVLLYPFPSSYRDQALVWQATSGLRYRIVGGRGIVAGPGGAADHGLAPGTPEGTMSALSASYSPHAHMWLPPPPTPAAVRSFRGALRTWDVTNIVMTSGGRQPDYARQWLATVLGTPPKLENGAWVWNDVQRLIS
ncbi:MAG TPA: hypothetical protein VIV12_01790 [Streptosporangiaceae bacterium]